MSFVVSCFLTRFAEPFSFDRGKNSSLIIINYPHKCVHPAYEKTFSSCGMKIIPLGLGDCIKRTYNVGNALFMNPGDSWKILPLCLDNLAVI